MNPPRRKWRGRKSPRRGARPGGGGGGGGEWGEEREAASGSRAAAQQQQGLVVLEFGVAGEALDGGAGRLGALLQRQGSARPAEGLSQAVESEHGLAIGEERL